MVHGVNRSETVTISPDEPTAATEQPAPQEPLHTPQLLRLMCVGRGLPQVVLPWLYFALLVACFATQGASYIGSILLFLLATASAAVVHYLLVRSRWDVRESGRIGVLDTALTIPVLILTYLAVTGVYRVVGPTWSSFLVYPLVVRLFGNGVGNTAIAATPYLTGVAIGTWIVVLGVAVAELIVLRRQNGNTNHRLGAQPLVLADKSPRRTPAVVLALAILLVGLAVPSTAAAVFQIRSIAHPGDVWAVGDVAPPADYNRDVARRVPNLHNVVKIATSVEGSAAAAVTSDGAVWFWSLADLSPRVPWTQPYRVDGLSDVVDVALTVEDYDYTSWNYVVVAVKSDGTVWVWSPRGTVHRLAGPDDVGPAPAQVPGLGHIIAVSTALNEILAVGSDGSAWAWGRLGAPRIDSSSIPILMDITDVATALRTPTHYAVLKSDGSIWMYTYPYGCFSQHETSCEQAWRQIYMPRAVTLTGDGYVVDVNHDLWRLADDAGAPTLLMSNIEDQAADFALTTDGRVCVMTGRDEDPITPVIGLNNVKAIAGSYSSVGIYAIQG